MGERRLYRACHVDARIEGITVGSLGLTPPHKQSVSQANTVNNDIQIQEIGPPQRDLLIAMYDCFEPLGAALGLPPCTSDGRHQWIGIALSQVVTVAAFSPDGEVVGHCFLAADQSNSAEIAVFVRKEFRRKGIGVGLVTKALDRAAAERLECVWAVTACDNRAALQLLMRSGFRLLKSTIGSVKLDIDLRARTCLAAH